MLATAVWIGVMTAGEFTVTDMWPGLRTYAEDIFRGFSVERELEIAAFGLLPSLGAAVALWPPCW